LSHVNQLFSLSIPHWVCFPISSFGPQVLQGRWDQCRTCWIKRQGPKVLQPCTLAPPNPACTICRRQTILLRVDTNTFTLAQLFKAVLQKGMALNEPDVDVTNREYAQFSV
jgi:hypothetical protein